MGVGAAHGDAVPLSRQHVGHAAAAAHEGRAVAAHAAVGALGTAQAELGHPPAGSRVRHARRLGSDEGLEVHAVEYAGLEQLALHEGAGHAQQRLAGEDHGAVGHGVDVDLQLHAAQPLQEGLIKQRRSAGGLEASEVVDVAVVEAEALDELDHLVHAAAHRVAALEGVVAEEHVEAGLDAGLELLPVALRHRELVEVGEEREIAGHGAAFLSGWFLLSYSALGALPEPPLPRPPRWRLRRGFFSAA